MLTREWVEDTKTDLKNKISACTDIGLGDLAHTLNEALNLIEEMEDNI